MKVEVSDLGLKKVGDHWSSVTPRFLAVRVGANTELVKVVVTGGRREEGGAGGNATD